MRGSCRCPMPAAGPGPASQHVCSHGGARHPAGTGPRRRAPALPGRRSLPVCWHWEKEEERREGAAPGLVSEGAAGAEGGAGLAGEGRGREVVVVVVVV